LVEAILAREPDGAGYLAIYVERSERRPHRCELGVGRYFKRIGDSSLAMEHYDIEDSFKRIVVPQLEVAWLVTPGIGRGGPDGQFQQIKIEIGLHNPSPVSARFPYISLTSIRGASLSPRSAQLYQPDLRYNADRRGHHFYGRADDVLHPGLTATIPHHLQTPEIRVTRREGGRLHVHRGAVQPVTAVYQCGSYNSRPTTGNFTISDDELVKHGIAGDFIY
jgi:hypothetical protein